MYLPWWWIQVRDCEHLSTMILSQRENAIISAVAHGTTEEELSAAITRVNEAVQRAKDAKFEAARAVDFDKTGYSCPECMATDDSKFEFDVQSATAICRDCGIVVGEGNQRMKGGEQVGGNAPLAKAHAVVQHGLGKRGTGDNRTRDRRQPHTRQVAHALEQFGLVAHKLELPATGVERAQAMLAAVHDTQEHVHKIEAVLAACVVLGCREATAAQPQAPPQAPDEAAAAFECLVCSRPFGTESELKCHVCVEGTKGKKREREEHGRAGIPTGRTGKAPARAGRGAGAEAGAEAGAKAEAEAEVEAEAAPSHHPPLPAAGDGVSMYKADLTAFYMEHAPARITKVDGLLANYDIVLLAKTIQNKYGCVPAGWEELLEDWRLW